MDKTKKYFSLLFLIVLLSDIYIYSFRIIIAIEFVAFALILMAGAKKFSYSFLKTITPLICIFILGFVGLVYYHSYTLSEIIKDICHLIKPVLAVCIGYMFARLYNDYLAFIKIIVIAGMIVALVHIGMMAFFADFSMNLNDIRTLNGRDSFLEMFSLWFLIANPSQIKNRIFNNKLLYKIGVTLLTVSCLLYVSRAMLVGFVLLVLAFFGYSKITYRSLKIIGTTLLCVIALYVYLFSIKLDRNGKGAEAFFYKIQNAPAEIFETKIDRENHAELWDHWRGYEMKRAFALMNANPASYLFGTGTGSVVDLKFKAPLDNDNKGMRYISILHNGYIFIFYKTGIIGIVLLLSFLIGIYLFIYRIPKDEQHKVVLVSISSIGAFYMFSSIIISGLYIPKDSVVFILGGLLFYEQAMRKGKMADDATVEK